MEDVIDQLREQAEVISVTLELPEEEDLVLIEEELLLPIPFELREFLLKVSDVVFGSLEPVTVADPNSHTYLPEVASMAWSLGVSRELVPLCEAHGGYYCVSQEGDVNFVGLNERDEFSSDESDDEDNEWASVWHWVKEVWLES
jgi:hypothetical protein